MKPVCILLGDSVISSVLERPDQELLLRVDLDGVRGRGCHDESRKPGLLSFALLVSVLGPDDPPDVGQVGRRDLFAVGRAVVVVAVASSAVAAARSTRPGSGPATTPPGAADWRAKEKTVTVRISCPSPHTSICARQMAQQGFSYWLPIFLPPYTVAPGLKPTSVKLHQTGTLEGSSPD